MIGIGLTPEGIHNNEVMFDFMNENSWRDEPRNIIQWIREFAVRRYGGYNMHTDIAWQLLKSSVYNRTDGSHYHGKTPLVRRPTLKLRTDIWYDPESVYQAWDHLVQASDSFTNSALFRYDLVDVTRQCLQLIFIQFAADVQTYYEDKDIKHLVEAGKKVTKLMDDLDLVLGSDPNFLLGKWIEDAKALATNENESRLYEYNARNQVTLWGPYGEIVDYAAKEWSGLVNAYYRPRWQLLISELHRSLQEGTSFSQKNFTKKVLKEVEEPFTFYRSIFPSVPKGDAIEIAKSLHSYYRPATRTPEHREIFKNLRMLNERLASDLQNTNLTYLDNHYRAL